VHQGTHRGGFGRAVPPQRQRPDAGIDEQAQSRARSDL
jgi:hypothetical protein